MPKRPPTHGQTLRKLREPLRGSAASRGYDYDWVGLRDAHMRANPLCADPFGVHAQEQRIEAAAEVDHIKPFHGKYDPLRLDPANIQSLCKSCHSTKTATEDGGFGR